MKRLSELYKREIIRELTLILRIGSMVPWTPQYPTLARFVNELERGDFD